jgi:hypothetical protein
MHRRPPANPGGSGLPLAVLSSSKILAKSMTIDRQPIWLKEKPGKPKANHVK